jgi:hypothetical protein
MNTEMNQGHEASEVRKCYHAPELTMLGAITSVVQSGTGGSGDAGDNMTNGIS